MIRNLKIGTGFLITTIKAFIIIYLIFLIYIYLFISSNIIPAYALNKIYYIFIKVLIISVFGLCWEIFTPFEAYAFKDEFKFITTRKLFYISSQILKFILFIRLSILYLLFYNVLNIIFNFNRQIIDLENIEKSKFTYFIFGYIYNKLAFAKEVFIDGVNYISLKI